MAKRNEHVERRDAKTGKYVNVDKQQTKRSASSRTILRNEVRDAFGVRPAVVDLGDAKPPRPVKK